MVLDDKYEDKIQDINFKPIFILGFHRSGTSLLYKLLSETNKFNTISAYHCIRYNELLYNFYNDNEIKTKKEINNYLQKKGQKDRGIDRLKLSSDFKEEYCFIFTNKNYDAWINKKNIQLFKQICKKIQLISNNKKPILLKNPYDFSNFLYIKNNFPNARFIFIHRNPLNIINSNIKSIRNLFRKKNYYTALLSKKYKKVSQNTMIFNLYRLYLKTTTFFRCIYITKLIKKNIDYYLKNIKRLDQRTYISTTYEKLCQNPESEMKKILNFFNIEPEKEINYEKQIKQRKLILIKDLQILESYIRKKLNSSFSKLGYNLIEE